MITFIPDFLLGAHADITVRRKMLTPGLGQEVEGNWERALPGEPPHLKPLPPLPFRVAEMEAVVVF